MTPEETKEIKETLELHRTIMIDVLNHPDRYKNNFHKILAGSLRLLLCNANTPVLLHFAKNIDVELLIAAYLSITERLPDLPKPIFEMPHNGEMPHWITFQRDLPFRPKILTIESFLTSAIGIVPVGNTGKTYTPKQIIKWTANKDGFSHLEFKKPATLKALKGISLQSGDIKTSEIFIKNFFFSLAQWAIFAITLLLAKEKLLAEKAKKNSPKKTYKPEKKDLIAHYKPLETSIYQMFLEGGHMAHTENMNASIQNGFSTHMLIHIPKYQLNQGERALYSGASSNNYFRFFITSKDADILTCSVHFGTDKSLSITITLPDELEGNEDFFTISTEVKVTDKHTKLIVTLNGKKQFQQEIDFLPDLKELILDKHVFGGGVDREPGLTCCLNELILCQKCYPQSELKSISNYLWESTFTCI